MKHLSLKRIILLLLSIWLVSCGGHAAKTTSTDECALIQDTKQKYKCYRSDIFYLLRTQVRADLLTWIQSQGHIGHGLVSGVRAKIDLDDEGGVKKATLLDSSGNGGFDAVFIQSIYNSGPFKLPENIPENQSMRQSLKRISWGIRL